ncbi:MAG: single-stranded-DNA-specific exonuclease RecJ [Pyrinomonadaceae bacterium]
MIRKHDHKRAAEFARSLGLSPLAAALLIARGFDTRETARGFLTPKLEDLHDPMLLKGMDAAIARIQKAIDNKEKVLIWGDYDVDGTTGTVVLRRALKALGAETGYHIPNRFTEGYGINIPALEKAKADGFSLVISVDTGTTSVREVEFANTIGLDVIITDHHLPRSGEDLPNAVAIVNPNQPGCEYPDKHLAGVGVAFKVACELLGRNGHDDLVKPFLKIAAIGTIADIMKLTGENRAIVSLGLKDLPKTKNYGLKALMEVADCRSEMTSYHIGFRIAPRINAAGRMDVARHVVELFEEDDFMRARKLADILDSRNRERQQVQQRITEMALLEGENLDRQSFIVVAGENWHKGVIGLAASRIAEQFYRPTIVLSVENGVANGSARSIGNFHLLNALESCSELFEQFGGHAAAAGMKIRSENIPELRERLNSYAAGVLSDEELIPELKIDALVSAETLDLKLVDELSIFEPFGAGNTKPIFTTRNLFVDAEPIVMKEKHLKIHLRDGSGKRFEAVWWDGVRKINGRTLKRGGGIELAYVAEVNEWQGNRRLQLVVEDLRTDN